MQQQLLLHHVCALRFWGCSSPAHTAGHFSTHWNCNHTPSSVPRKIRRGRSLERCLQARGTGAPGDGHTQRLKQLRCQLTHFTMLPGLSELLKPSSWLLLSLTWLIVFAQPPCRLCSLGERVGRLRIALGAWPCVLEQEWKLLSWQHPAILSPDTTQEAAWGKSAWPFSGDSVLGSEPCPLSPQPCLDSAPPELAGAGSRGRLCAISLLDPADL